MLHLLLPYERYSLIDTTLGVENVTWYRTDMRDKHRIVVTFQDELRTDHPGEERIEGEIEMWGDSAVVPYSRLGIDSPEVLEELIEALQVAVGHWRHCIEECDCYTEDEEAPSDTGVKILSFGGMDFGLWTPGEEGHEDDDEPETDPDEDNQAPNG